MIELVAELRLRHGWKIAVVSNESREVLDEFVSILRTNDRSGNRKSTSCPSS
jgi:hypothetical protein